MLRRLLPLLALAQAGCATNDMVATENTRPMVNTAAVPTVPVPLMKEVIARLASNEFEGRGPDTRTEDLTITEIITRFKAAGLQGNKGQWLQEVPTGDITAKSVSPLTVSGGANPLSFAYGSDFVAGSYRVTPQTGIANSEMVFVGYGIVAPELGWNDYAGVDMKGKTAIILVNDPDYAMTTEDGPFKGRRMTYYGRWTYKFEEAARQGAAAALIVHDTFPSAYGWNVVN